MEILISANEQILNMVKNKNIIVDENMTQEDFFAWTQGMTKEFNENELQEI
ncbi:MAG: hypothetical protein J6A03_09955 [Lachnospiraceae bacterium]|nr:hypothetical protein [Lachnospiraceae bacterium]